jgi:hypothetical protein
MSDFPVVFTPADTTLVTEDTTNLSYLCPPIQGFRFTDKVTLPFLPEAQGIQLALQGNFNEHAFAFTRHRRTQTYLLETLYLVPFCPTFSVTKLTDPTRHALVVKGSVTENGVQQTLFLYIPFESQTVETCIVQVNLFDKVNQLMVNALNNDVNDITGTTIDLNKMIPKTPFHYYELMNDKKNIILFFDSSSLILDSAVIGLIPSNMDYNKKTTNKTFTLYESVNPPEMRRITTGMEDNIYIDCMPVELVNEDKKTFMKQMEVPTLKGANGLPVVPMPNVQGLNYATDLIDQTSSYLEKSTHYILFLVFLALIVFLIFSIKKMFRESADSTEEDILPLLKEIQKKVNP